MGDNEQELLTTDKDPTEQEEISETEVEETIEKEVEAESEHTPKTDTEEASAQDNLTKKTIEQLEAKAQMKIDALEQQKKLAEADIEKYSTGKMDQITQYEEKEKAITEKDAASANEKLELEKNKSAIDSMKKEADGMVKTNTKLQKKLKSLQGRQTELGKKQDTTKKEMEEITKLIPVLQSTPEKFYQLKNANKKKAQKYEEKLRSKEAEMQTYQTEAETLPAQIEQLEAEITKWTEQIEKQRAEIKEKAESFTAQETAYKQQQKELSEEKKQHKKEKPKDYEKYKAATKQLETTNKGMERAAAEKEGVKDRVSKMERRTVDHGAAGSKDILVEASSGEAFGEGQITSEDSKAAEEVKVETSIKNAPIFQEVNKEGINKTLHYNEETGQQDEEKHDAPMIEQLKKLQENMKTNEGAVREEMEAIKNDEKMKARIEALKGSEKFKWLEEKLKLANIDNPITALLDALMKLDFEVCLSTVEKCTTTMGSADFQKNSPLLYNMLSAAYESIEPMLDQADNGDIYKDQAKKNAALPKIGDTIAKILDKVLEFFGPTVEKAKETEEGSEPESTETAVKSEEETPDENVEKMKSSGKAALAHGKQFFQTKGDAKKFREKGNEKYARILEGTKRGAVNNGLSCVIDAAAAGGQKLAGTSAADIAGKRVNFSSMISGFSGGLKKFAGFSVNKADQNAILKSPEVFGNINYDEKKVPESRFNEILKEQTGITSKEGVYNAIKSTDAVGLHADMRNSMDKPDGNIDSVMGNLGFQDRTKYKNISVVDIMRKTGHAPTGGDWRKELQQALQVEGVDYKSKKDEIKDTLKGFAASSWNALKDPLGQGLKSIASSALSFAKSGGGGFSGSFGDKLKEFAKISLGALGGLFG